MIWKKVGNLYRLSDGNSANVNWNPDNEWLNVNANYSDNRNPNAGGREEVSHQKESHDSFCVKYLIQPFVILEIS